MVKDGGRDGTRGWRLDRGCQAQPMQGLLIIHVYQESKRSHIYVYVFVMDTALSCTYRYGPPAELQKILPFPSGGMSGGPPGGRGKLRAAREWT